jgi:hypothetical protein
MAFLVAVPMRLSGNTSRPYGLGLLVERDDVVRCRTCLVLVEKEACLTGQRLTCPSCHKWRKVETDDLDVA